jgi:hypothetical protein
MAEPNQREREFDKYRGDFNPNDRGGENRGPAHYQTISADQIKEVYDRYPDLNDAALMDIPVVVEGEQLEEGEVYFDLKHPEHGEFRGMNDMCAGPDNWFVPKNRVSYELWNVLIGVKEPERLGRFSEAA